MHSLAMQIAAEVLPRLEDVLTGCSNGWSFEPLITTPLTADANTKIVLRDRRGTAQAILLCSSPQAPTVVAQALASAERARSLLPGPIAAAILAPLATGECKGMSYAVLPWCHPLADQPLFRFFQKRWLLPRIFKWLRAVNATTLQQPSPIELEQCFLAPLSELASSGDLNPDIRLAAEIAGQRAREGFWQPKFVLAHNDLWKGNILIRGQGLWSLWRGPRPFAIIDWAGSHDQGHAFYDLVRLTDSFHCERSDWIGEFHAHCNILDCTPFDAYGYLLSSLGALGMDPGCFSRERFVRLVHHSCQQLLSVMHGTAAIPSREPELMNVSYH